MPTAPVLSRLTLTLCLAFGALSRSAGAAEPPLAIPGGKPYTVTIGRVTAKPGLPATASVVITPSTGYHINKDFPTSLKLIPPPGVTLAKADLRQADAKLTESEGRFEVVLTASAAGVKSIPGDLRFAVCTDTTCNPQRSPVAIEVNVQ